jgi:ABC-type transport system involved in multi-copper enzyme maturation permease subunit
VTESIAGELPVQSPSRRARLGRATRWIGSIFWNPIVEKEVLSRMRSGRAPLLITVFITLLALVALGSLAVISAQQNGPFSGSVGAGAGLGIFASMTVLELVLILFMAPALTAGAISGERERQTLDLLLCTPVRPSAIVAGKLVSSLMFMLLLLLVSVPLFSVVFLFGGIELDQVLAALVIAVVTAILLGSFGMFISALARGTISSTVGTYALTFLFLVIPVVAPILTSALQSRSPFFSDVGDPVYRMANPFVVLQATLTSPSGSRIINGGGPVPMGGPGNQMICTKTTNGQTCQSSGVPLGIAPAPGFSTSTTPGPPPLPFGNIRMNGDQVAEGLLGGWHAWQIFVLVDGVIALLALFLSTLLLGRRLPSGRRMAPNEAVAPTLLPGDSAVPDGPTP